MQLCSNIYLQIFTLYDKSAGTDKASGKKEIKWTNNNQIIVLILSILE